MHVNVLSVSHSCQSLANGITFFLLTHSNVLMDRGGKDNEGEERGKEEQRTEGQYDTLRQMRLEILKGDSVGIQPTYS